MTPRTELWITGLDRCHWAVALGKSGVNTLWDRQVALIRGGMSIPGGEREAPGEEKAPEAVLNQDVGGVPYSKAVQSPGLGPCTCTLQA